MQFIDEEGADGGGLTREFYTLLGENLQINLCSGDTMNYNKINIYIN